MISKSRRTLLTSRESAMKKTAPKFSYLKDHIRDLHPSNKDGEKFGLCSKLGMMPVFKCMNREPSELA